MAQADLAVAEGQALQAGATSSAAQAAAREAAVVEGYTHITSPADGVVVERPVAPGTLVQPGTEILGIAEIDRVRVQANVAVEDVAGMHVGSPVEIDVQGDSTKVIEAHVTSVFPAANDQTRTAVVEAVIPNPGHRLLPGAFVTMRITKGNVADKLLVPASSITTIGGQSYVWAVQGGSQSAGPVYECVICHIHYTAAQAAKFHYRDPMDGGKLIPLKNSQASLPHGVMMVRQVAVQTGASDGAWTEVVSGDLKAGDRAVTHGQAGLSDGARVIAAAWGSNGPIALPTAAEADAGLTVYRCEKCGMTFSAADAARDHYIDPMDGGRLMPARRTGRPQ
jgi:multidrug efflux pump subunit AcrA (membrane-fusion protein)